jgi:hypothetical protein
MAYRSALDVRIDEDVGFFEGGERHTRLNLDGPYEWAMSAGARV